MAYLEVFTGKFLLKSHPRTKLSRMQRTEETVINYMLYLRSKGLSNTTIKGYTKRLKKPLLD